MRICSPIFGCFQKPEKINTFFEKIQKNWADAPQELEDHPDFCEFLYKSRILFVMLAYKNSLEKQQPQREETAPMQEMVRMEGGHPQLLKQNRWVRWDEIQQDLELREKQIVSRGNPEETWNYYYDPEAGEMGLNPSKRFNELRPFYQLTKEEMEELGANGENLCLIQVFSSNTFFLTRVSHIGIRIIKSNGMVYSPAFEINSHISFQEINLTGTYSGAISSLDQNELAPFEERRVTTFPRTEAQIEKVFAQVNEYIQQQTLSYNFAHQNCVKHAVTLLRIAEVEPEDVQRPAIDGLWDIVLETPYLGAAIKKVSEVVQAIFEFLSNVPLIQYPVRGFLALIRKIDTFLSNLFFLSLGGSNSDGLVSGDAHNPRELTRFERLYSRWTHLFSDAKSIVFSPLRFVNWQEKQANTYYYNYKGPRFYGFKPKQQANI